MHNIKKRIYPERIFISSIRDKFTDEYFSVDNAYYSSGFESYWTGLDDWVRENTGLKIADYENPWSGGYYLIDEQKYILARLKYM